MSVQKVDIEKAVKLHRDKNWPVPRIAALFGVQRQAVWRAFRTAGYEPPGTIARREAAQRRLDAVYASIGTRRPATSRRESLNEALANAPRVHRDPCQRCGCRGDIECKHRWAPPLGVRFG